MSDNSKLIAEANEYVEDMWVGYELVDQLVNALKAAEAQVAALQQECELSMTTIAQERSRAEHAEAKSTKMRKALVHFAKHFGPLEENELLHPAAKECFAISRAALEGK